MNNFYCSICESYIYKKNVLKFERRLQKKNKQRIGRIFKRNLFFLFSCLDSYDENFVVVLNNLKLKKNVFSIVLMIIYAKFVSWYFFENIN